MLRALWACSPASGLAASVTSVRQSMSSLYAMRLHVAMDLGSCIVQSAITVVSYTLAADP